jgi:diguanylate cyclase (GGDEF)-like protein/PAS domain S-box-containing protein
MPVRASRRGEVTDPSAPVEAKAAGEEQLRLLVASVVDYAIVMLDPAGRVVSWNAGAERIKGYREDDILGRSFEAFYSTADVESGVPARHLAEAAKAGHLQYEGWRVRRDGSRFWADVVITALFDEQGRLRGFGKVTRDATERRNAQQKLQNSEERFRLLVENVRDYAIVMLDQAGRVVGWNAGAQHVKGYRAEDILGRSFEAFYTPEDVLAGTPARHLAGAASAGHLQYEGWRVRGDGTRFWADVVITALFDSYGQLRGFGKVTRDVTARRAAEQELVHRSVHDPLTDLPNRTLLLDRLGHALARLDRHRGNVAVFFVDLDRFKSINDRVGHLGGDRLLVAVAQRLLAALRPEDTVSRLSGDEFVVLCEDVAGHREAAEIAQRLVVAFADPVDVGQDRVPVSASIGVAISGCSDEVAESLLRDADTAMYQAKRDRGCGQARFQLFDPAMQMRLAQRLELETALAHAADRDELRLVYQPVVQLNTEVVASFEALLRWHRPEQGVVPPDDFIPLAEQTGLIRPIGAWVLQEACHQLASWSQKNPGGRPLGMAVNISAGQLNADLVDVVIGALASTGVEPATLCLELTESSVMADPDASLRVLGDLKALGLSLAIDDFGTGYSSLSYLQRLPVDTVKIDRSFIDGLGTERENSAIVAATVKMAHALALTVVAEGVETPLQAAELRGLKCDYAQGWHFGRPQPPDAVAVPAGH